MKTSVRLLLWTIFTLAVQDSAAEWTLFEKQNWNGIQVENLNFKDNFDATASIPSEEVDAKKSVGSSSLSIEIHDADLKNVTQASFTENTASLDLSKMPYFNEQSRRKEEYLLNKIQSNGNQNSSMVGRLLGILPQVIRYGVAKANQDGGEDTNTPEERKKRSLTDLWYDYAYDYSSSDYCDYPPCPVWSEWHGGSCSSSCGGGKQLFVRYCDNSIPDKFQGGCEGTSAKTEECNTQACPDWSPWTSTNECSVSCGKGLMKYTRQCLMDGKIAEGGCTGVSEEFRVCSRNVSCPPQWTAWSRYMACSKTCGNGGFRLRKRLCFVNGKAVTTAKVPCIGDRTQKKGCRQSPRCPIRFTNWGQWSRCDALTCGAYGSQSRTRKCLSASDKEPREELNHCEPGQLVQKRTCRSKSCARGCAVVVAQMKLANQTMETTTISRSPLPTWSQWSEWSPCTVSCGLGGTQTRNRMCFGVRLDEASAVVLERNKACKGLAVESRECHHGTGCPHWDTWSVWTPCTRTCGIPGRRRRSRQCIEERYHASVFAHMQPISTELEEDGSNFNGSGDKDGGEIYLGTDVTLYSGKLHQAPTKEHVEEIVVLEPSHCHGGEDESEMTGTCNEHPCPPKWGKWATWSSCSVSCGQGQMQRTRRCRGKGSCYGEKMQFQPCYRPPCWDPWSGYGPCTTSCGSGVRERSRKCRGTTQQIAKYAQCRGESVQKAACNEEQCPEWEDWGPWGNCSVACGDGLMARTRECKGGKCHGRNRDIKSCTAKPCPYWEQWSQFSCCSVSCGHGVKSRTRICRHAEPGDKYCPGSATEERECYRSECKDTVVPTPDPPQCGIKPNKLGKAILRIFSGKLSADHEWPWQSSWQHYTCLGGSYKYFWEHLCGATVIGSQWVITAGHCIKEGDYPVVVDDPGNEWSVVIGMTELYENGDRYFLERVLVHSQYDYSGVPKNDIALLKLRKPVPLTENVRPACLPGVLKPQEDEECYISGWGNQSPRSSLSKSLRHAKIPVLDFRECQKLGHYYRTYLSNGTHMCAGDPNTVNAADSCRGDSGGPMVCSRKNGQWYLAGITSFGFTDCGVEGEVGIYVPMSGYETWVKATIKKYSKTGC